MSSRKRSKTPQIYVKKEREVVKGLVKINLIAIRRTVAGTKFRNSCAELEKDHYGSRGYGSS